MNQFISSPAMVRSDHLSGFKQMTHPLFLQLCVDGLPHPEIGVKKGVRSGKLQKQLAVFNQGVAEDGSEKSLDSMGGEEILRVTLNGCGITLVFLKGIKVNQMPAGAIQKETEQLLEHLTDRLAFPALAHRAKESFKMRIKLDPSKIADKETQTTSVGECIRGDLNGVDDLFEIVIDCVKMLHDCLPPSGLRTAKLLPFGFCFISTV